jgi:hypothetical protein
VAYPSTFLDLQQRVADKLRLDANPTAGTGQDLDKIKNWVNQAYLEATELTEATQTAGTAVLTANYPSYLMPTQVVRIKQLVIWSNGYGPPLTETSLDDILRRRQGSPATLDIPTRYALVNQQQLEFWPTPAQNNTIVFYYVGQLIPLSVNTDKPSISEPYATRLLEYGALAEAADFLREPNEPNYRQLYDYWIGRYRQHLNRRAGGHTKQFLQNDTSYTPSDPSTDTGC